MKAAILHGDRAIGVADAPDPRIGSDEVLFKISHAGICGTDLHSFRSEFRELLVHPWR